MNSKLQWLRNTMSSLDLQGMIVSNPINIKYLTKIEAEGVLLFTRKENIYITDGRYIEQVHSILTLYDEIIVYDINDVSKDDYENFFMFCVVIPVYPLPMYHIRSNAANNPICIYFGENRKTAQITAAIIAEFPNMTILRFLLNLSKSKCPSSPRRSWSIGNAQFHMYMTIMTGNDKSAPAIAPARTHKPIMT